MESGYIHVLSTIRNTLEQENITYQFTGATSLLVQGVKITNKTTIEVSVQWDLFDETYALFSNYSPTIPEKNAESAAFHIVIDGIQITIFCFYNLTIKTDPYRISVFTNGEEFWCRSLYSFLYDRKLSNYSEEIHAYLASTQQGLTLENEQAWNQNNYLALVNRYGKPEEMALKVLQNPKWRLHPFYKYFEDISSKKITHLMGSNGIKAVALALLGAHVKVVDFSKENAAYATELATACDVSIDYVVSDVLSLSSEHIQGNQDIVLMELGVLHYYIDLFPLLKIIKSMLKPGGQFVLHEFHPISTKLITSTGKKHKVTGNYFAPEIEKSQVAFSKNMPEEEKNNLSQVLQKKWTLGELITAIGQSGLVIKVLEEEPNHKIHDIGLPKTYTLVAERL